MLNFMRKASNTIFIKVFLVLLIASFAVWGIGDVFRNRGSSGGVASVGDENISVQTFRTDFTGEVQRIKKILGPQITREQAVSMGVGDMLLRRLINSSVLNQGAKSMGLLVSKSTILDDIKSNPVFFNDAKVFDRRVFVDLLARNGLSEDTYVNRVRQNMARFQYLSPIANGPALPQTMTKALYAFAAEKRVLEVLRINHAQIKNVPQPTHDELVTYHKANAQLFMAPEYKSLSTLVLSAADIAKTLTVTPDELKIAYDERADAFTTPETRTLKQILTPDKATAQRAANLLDAGKSIAEAATEVGANPAMTTIGDMTRSEAASLSPALADAAFSTPVGSHSAPVKSPLGWHIIQVEAAQAGTLQPLAEVKDKLTSEVKLAQALKTLFKMSTQLEDLLGGGMTLEEAASEMGLSLSKVAAVDARGETPDNTLAALPYTADVLKEAAKLQAGGESQLVESTDGNAFFVVRVDDVIAPALRPLDTVLKRVALAWDSEKRAALAAKIAETAKTRLEGGESLTAVAKALGFDSFVTKPFTRTGQGLEHGALPAAVLSQAFTLAQGGVVDAPGTGAHTVARILKIQAASDAAKDPQYTAIVAQASTAMQGDLAAQLSAALQMRFPVTINRTVLNSVY